jgi:DNA-binding PadR family transcriptional regulator
MRGFMAGAVRLHVLHHAAHDDLHGSWLIDELARHGHRLSPGTLYPLLHRMEALGLLVSRTTVVDGHRLRCYRATPAGRRALGAAKRAVAELAEELLGAKAAVHSR